MKKIMNDPKHLLNELLEGFVYTHDHLVSRLEGTNVIHRN